jgi:hypothetical protein
MLVGVAGFFDLRLPGFFTRVPIPACKEFTRGRCSASRWTSRRAWCS